MPLHLIYVASVDLGLPDANYTFDFVKGVVLVALASAFQFALFEALLVNALLAQLFFFPQFIDVFLLAFKLLNQVFDVQ